jgi:serine protease Do
MALPCHASNRHLDPFAQAYKRVADSVVNIHGHKTLTGEEEGDASGPRRVNGMGTGVIIDERGYIITNHHVIDGVRRIKVTMADRRTVDARLIARDEKTDLAIIKIQAKESLPVLPIGTSLDLTPGESVIAIGNAYGYNHSVTRGIISALQRSVPVTDSQRYDNLIQTDASINPGNSGGPLLNIDGELIGINVAVRVGAQNIGFAIPVDDVMQVASQLLSTERTTGTWHGLVGESVIKGDERHFVVHSVKRDSPAEKAGLRPGDVVTQIGSVRVERGLDVERALLGVNPGEPVAVKLSRGESPSEVNMLVATTAGARPTANDANFDPWLVFGLELVPDTTSAHPKYREGLRVLRVRESSPAADQGIMPGDFLVGMHLWQTRNLKSLEYVVKHVDPTQDSPVKFYIVRGGDILEGDIPIRR